MKSRSNWIAGPLVIFLVAGTVAYGIAVAMPADIAFEGFANDGLYHAVLAAGALACLLRAVLVPEDRLAWALVGAGTASWAAGDIVRAVEHAGDPSPPFPSAADALNLAFYPLVVLGVLTLARSRLEILRGAVGLDGAIAGLGAAALAAALLGPAISAHGEGEILAALVDAAYPVADILIFAVAAAGAVVLGWRSDFVLLALGLIALGVADTAYLYAEATEGYDPGTLLDTAWLISATLIGLAAWQPTRGADPLTDARTIAMPALIALLAVGLLTADHFTRLSEESVLLAAATLVLAVARMVLSFDESRRLLVDARSDARTDALTGLGNRRRLIGDLERASLEAARDEHGYLFVIFDLDGFKGYNDSFGHAAGDLLLRRMGNALAAAVEGHGTAYRLGGDEFCVIAPLGGSRPASIVAAASASLREDGEAFVITASHGEALIPAEATEPSQALRLADRRLYAQKGNSPRSFARQARDLLLGVLRERQPNLGEHMEGVGALAAELGRRAGLQAEELDVVARAGELHDIGKMAIPDAILTKPGPLSNDEWELMRTHTLIGERILSVTPALLPVAKLIRASHERWDGTGYPDGIGGSAIPIGARIIAICDAFEAMTEQRPYRATLLTEEALAELRRNAGTQFDPVLVEQFVAVVSADAVADPVRI